jgi:RNA polymerase sigma factor for flagellar operon FliA
VAATSAAPLLTPESPGQPFPADRRALALRYAPFVRAVAGKVKRRVAREIEFEDLVEYGMLGLFEAADRFDARQGTRFLTFAYYRVRGAIYDGLRGMGWMTRAEYARARFEEKASRYLAEAARAEAAGEPPPASPVDATRAELEAAVHGLAAVYLTTLDGVEARRLAAEDAGPEESVGLDQARALVRAGLTRLPAQERRLLELYYYDDLSLEEVGTVLGLSKSWTCRLHARAIDRLQRRLAGSVDER